MTTQQLLADDESNGLLIDLDAARRNRENIERSRKAEPLDKRSGRFDDYLLKKREGKEMVTEIVAERQVLPMQTKVTTAKRHYCQRRGSRDFETEKDVIIADYQQLTLKEFYARHHLNSEAWGKLKALWNVQGKGRWGVRTVSTIKSQPVINLVKNNSETDSLPLWVEVLKRLEGKIDALDQAVGDLSNLGLMDDELKVDIIESLMKSNILWDDRTRAKKILYAIQIIEGV